MNSPLPRWASVWAWLDDPVGAFRRGEVSGEDVARFKEYMRYKDECQNLCRGVIFQRDRDCCLACAATASLNLAHITPVSAFVAEAGSLTAMIDSYTEDNLITLCEDCHAAFHMRRPASEDSQRRRAIVLGVFGGRMQRRGWETAAQFYSLAARPEPIPVRFRRLGMV